MVLESLIATGGVERIGLIAQRLVRELSNKDEKMHLHVLNTPYVASL